MRAKTIFVIVHTGDLIDFVSEANLDRRRKFTVENESFVAAGTMNSAFSLEKPSRIAEYRNKACALQKSFKNDIRFAARK